MTEQDIAKLVQKVESYPQEFIDALAERILPVLIAKSPQLNAALSAAIIPTAGGLQETAPAKQKTKRFIKPTVEEIRAYCAERRNTVAAESFYNFYEANGWRVGRNPMKDWKASVRTWEQRGGAAVATAPSAAQKRGDPFADYARAAYEKALR